MLSVDGRPLFANALEQLAREFEVEQLAFRVAYRPEAFITEWQAGKHAYGLPSTVTVGRITDGPIGALVSCCRFFRCETLVVVAGDVFFCVPSFVTLRQFHRSHGGPMSVAVAHGTPTSRPSTLQVSESGGLVGYCRKEMTTREDLINAGLYVIRPDQIGWLLDDFARHEAQTGESVEYKEDELWRLTVERPDRARFFVLPGGIVNVNTPEDLASAQSLARGDPAFDNSGAR